MDYEAGSGYCVKPHIKISLYYDARSEKHQILVKILNCIKDKIFGKMDLKSPSPSVL